MRPIPFRPILRLPFAIALTGLLLAGCQGAVSVDLSSGGSPDPTVSAVMVDVAGLEFRRTDGTTEKLEFTRATAANLVDLQQNAWRLFTDESLADGTYSGVRLLLDDNADNGVARFDGRQYPLNVGDGDYTDVDFTVVKDDASRENLALLLELRKSLSFDDDASEYSLTPVLRAIRSDEAAQVRGSVAISCPAGTSLASGGAVYLFAGHDIEPDDIGGSVDPLATASVVSDDFSGEYTYALRLLPAGDYTLAVTCNGQDDRIASNDDVNFRQSANISLDEGDALTRNFP